MRLCGFSLCFLFGPILASFFWVAAAIAQPAGLDRKAKPSPELLEIFHAEHAFANASVTNGMRAAFLEYFAPDGINFTPHPVNTRESLLARPAPPGKPPITLNWWPVFGDVSIAGDLGYTTGPFVMKDTRENDKIVGQGYYFSVWKKQPDGAWRVVADYGSEIPEWRGDRTPVEFNASRHAGTVTLDAPVVTPTTLLDLDRSFGEESVHKGTLRAYKRFSSWDDETRLYREQLNPLIGRDQIKRALAKLTIRFSWQPIAGDLARSGDLGYTYGKWQSDDRANRAGYYLRVWRMIHGEWRVVAEVMNPIPTQ